MHAVGVGSFGARIIARSSSSACGSPMAALKTMSLVLTPGAALTHLSAESFPGRNRILRARCWPGVGSNRSWSAQIRGDAGLAVSDASKVGLDVLEGFVIWVLFGGSMGDCEIVRVGSEL